MTNMQCKSCKSLISTNLLIQLIKYLREADIFQMFNAVSSLGRLCHRIHHMYFVSISQFITTSVYQKQKQNISSSHLIEIFFTGTKFTQIFPVKHYFFQFMIRHIMEIVKSKQQIKATYKLLVQKANDFRHKIMKRITCITNLKIIKFFQYRCMKRSSF